MDDAAVELAWGVKASFREYLRAIGDGYEVVSDGARFDSDGRVAFRASETIEAGSGSVLTFGGGVEFGGHGGLMVVRIREPWLTVNGDGLELSIMHPAFRDRTERRVTLAMLDLAPPAKPSDPVPCTARARLSMDGIGAFDGFYMPETELDPVILRRVAL